VAVIFIGTAGWNVPVPYADAFARSGSHLERYGAVMNAAEINSSFYRPHRRTTYERWAASVPAGFRFSVKLPRAITETRGLKDCDDVLARFLEETSGLGSKLGVLLAQLPPRLAFDPTVAADFFSTLRPMTNAAIACEPRHPGWFTPEADAVLRDRGVARIAADPPRAPQDGKPGGWPGLCYWRLHGSPKIYYSEYAPAALDAVAAELRHITADAWCIFDNTAAFAALGNALDLRQRLEPIAPRPITETVPGTEKKSMARKYSKAASQKVGKALHEVKKGTLKSGPGGKGGKVKSRKQAIAIGLSEARAEGKKVPKKKTTKKKAKKKTKR
jgi:uncharacterized protein YecE (DUF72 family)